jgi:hypothetical protein
VTNVQRKTDTRNANKILNGTCVGKRLLGSLRCRQEVLPNFILKTLDVTEVALILQVQDNS